MPDPPIAVVSFNLKNIRQRQEVRHPMEETDIARVRFGYGFGPDAPRLTARALFDGLAGPDEAMARFPSIGLTRAMEIGGAFIDARQAQRRGEDGAQARRMAAMRDLRAATDASAQKSIARLVGSASPLRERLTWFWADHFTVVTRNPAVRAANLSFLDETIRPHLTGCFADMLKAVTKHPAMLLYLDQNRSIGPASPAGQRTGRGLNENHARELLELHTIGADGAYTQDDVRQTAELLTGLSFSREDGFVFRPNWAEPGAETVFQGTYGGGRASVADIDLFLEDLARHPDTARHLARKLAVHFVSDDPPADLVAELTEIYAASDGDLGQVTSALLLHPSASNVPLGKVKTPLDFVASALIAFGVRGEDIMALPPRGLRQQIMAPLSRMGQPFMRPPGPDGWPEEAAHWITPQALAQRITWAVALAQRLGGEVEDPRAFLGQTLAGLASDRLRFAVSAAETHAEGLALVLASAEFNRR